MIKRLSLLRRRRDLSREQFNAYWGGPHAKLALEIPELAKYDQNRVARVLVERAGGSEGHFQVDGVVELYFADEAAMARAGASDVIRSRLPKDEHNLMHGITLTLTETEGEAVQDDALAKMMLVASVGGDSQIAEFRSEVRRLVSKIPHLQHVLFDWIGHVYWRPDLWHEPVVPDVVVSLRLSNDEAVLSAAAEAVREALPSTAAVGRASLVQVNEVHIL